LLTTHEPLHIPQLLEPEIAILGYPGRLAWVAAHMRAGHVSSAEGSDTVAAADGQSGSPARRREEAICSASAGFLKGSLLMNCAIEKSGLMDRHVATLALAQSISPRRAWHAAVSATLL